MEARSFFENSPMAEITVSATPEEWREFLSSIGEVDPWLDPESPAWNLERALKEVGID
jgi:hypothetical protein